MANNKRLQYSHIGFPQLLKQLWKGPTFSYGNPQGHRNDIGIGGAIFFFKSHLYFKRIQFCTLVYLWFVISTELWTYFSHISIHWFICRCFYTLEFLGLAKYGGGAIAPPPLPPVPTAMTPPHKILRTNLHLLERSRCHAWGRVSLLYPEHLVPLPIWIITPCPFFII